MQRILTPSGDPLLWWLGATQHQILYSRVSAALSMQRPARRGSRFCHCYDQIWQKKLKEKGLLGLRVSGYSPLLQGTQGSRSLKQRVTRVHSQEQEGMDSRGLVFSFFAPFLRSEKSPAKLTNSHTYLSIYWQSGAAGGWKIEPLCFKFIILQRLASRLWECE